MPQKIPIPIGILLVILLIGGLGFVTSAFQTKTSTLASGSETPKYITITNLKPSGLTVLWQTDTETTGQIMITNGDGTKLVGFDDRDKAGIGNKYRVHSATIQGLQKNTSYNITIITNGKRYEVESPTSPVQTPDEIAISPSSLEPAYGALTPDASGTTETGVVTLQIGDSQELSTTLTKNGSWVIPLSTLRTRDLSSNYTYPTNAIATITVRTERGETKAQTRTSALSPVPPITIGSSNDFTREPSATNNPPSQISLTPTEMMTPIPTKSLVLGVSTDKKSNTGKIQLLTPQRGAALSANRPYISGNGNPGKKVTLTIGRTKPEVVSLVVDDSGFFHYTPKNPLPSGQTSITMTTMSSKNKPVAVTHTFTVFKSGTQVLGDATASATLAPTLSPTLLPTESMEEPTPEPTLEEDSTETEGDPMPTTGNTLPLILILLGAASMIGVGVHFSKK